MSQSARASNTWRMVSNNASLRAGTSPFSGALAQIRAHFEASSSSLGSFTANGYRSSSSLPDMLYERRRRFLTEANLSQIEARRLQASGREREDRKALAELLVIDGSAVVFKAWHVVSFRHGER